ncbi:MAG: polymer-forming cytoskeletal protein [Gemmatimonadota bacterium]
MSIFSQSSGTSNGPAAPARRRPDAHTLSIIAADLTVTGDLSAEGVVRVEGRVTGNVRAGQQILLSEGGVVDGDLETREAVIAGEVRGTIVVSERLEVQATAMVAGDVTTPRLLVHEGARINGAVRMEVVSKT